MPRTARVAGREDAGAHRLLVRVRSRGLDRLRSLAAARRRGLLGEGEHDPEAAAASYAPQLDGPDRARARSALATLPAEQRQLIELAYFEGLTCSEMATHCATPIGTVKSRLAAAMAKLRAQLAVERESG